MRNEAAVDPKLVAIKTGLKAAEDLLTATAETTPKSKDVKDIVSELVAAGVKGLSADALGKVVAEEIFAQKKAQGSFKDRTKVPPYMIKTLKPAEWLPALIKELKYREANFGTIRAAENAKDAEAEANAKAVDDVFALGGELWTPREEAAVDDDVVAGPAF